MSYHFSKSVDGIFDQVVDRTIAVLQENGFGVLTSIDIKATLKAKIDADFRPYVILGACNPGYAFKALQAESHIGLMLPCNVIVQLNDDDTIEISAVDPVASMQAIENDELEPIAGTIRDLLKKVIADI